MTIANTLETYTTASRDAEPSWPANAMINNSTTGTIQITVDGGSAWQDLSTNLTGNLLAANNLSDVASKEASIRNIGAAEGYDPIFDETDRVYTSLNQPSVIIANYNSPNHTIQLCPFNEPASPLGGFAWGFISNVGASSFDLIDANAALIRNVEPGDAYLIKNSDQTVSGSVELLPYTFRTNDVFGDVKVDLQSAFDKSTSNGFSIENKNFSVLDSGSVLGGQSVTAGGSGSALMPGVQGTVYSSANGIYITALGVWDAFFTLPGVRTVGIYDRSSQDLLASVDVSKTDDLNFGVRLRDLNSPIYIPAATEFVIAQRYLNGEFYFGGFDAVGNTGITVVEGANTLNTTGLEFPANFDGTPGSSPQGFFSYQILDKLLTVDPLTVTSTLPVSVTSGDLTVETGRVFATNPGGGDPAQPTYSRSGGGGNDGFDLPGAGAARVITSATPRMEWSNGDTTSYANIDMDANDITNVNDITLNNGSQINVAGSSTTFDVVNDTQGTGTNLSIHPSENIFFKPINLQNNVNITFPFETNDIGSSFGSRLNNLYANNVDSDNVLVNSLSANQVVASDGSGNLVSSNPEGIGAATPADILFQNSYDNEPEFLVNDVDAFNINVNDLSAPLTAHTIPAPNSSGFQDEMEGFRIVFDSDSVVTALQYPDLYFTLPGTREVGIWLDSNGLLLGQVTIAKTDPLIDGYRTMPITNVPVVAGIEYIVAALVPVGEQYTNSAASVPAAGVTIPGAAFGGGPLFNFPTVRLGVPNQALTAGCLFSTVSQVPAISVDGLANTVTNKVITHLTENPVLCGMFIAPADIGADSFPTSLTVSYGALAEGTWTKVANPLIINGLQRGDISFDEATTTVTINKDGLYRIGLQVEGEVDSNAERVSMLAMPINVDDTDKALGAITRIISSSETNSNQWNAFAGSMPMNLLAGDTVKVFYCQLHPGGGASSDFRVASIKIDIQLI